MQSNTNEAPGVPQYLVEPILNLYRAGTSPQTISQSFNLSLESVITFLSSQQNDPALNFFQTLQRKSEDFRCNITKHLMHTPVVASDGKVYDQRALQAWVKTSKVSPVTGEKLSAAKPFPLLDLKERIKEFCRSALVEIDPILRLNLDDDAPVVLVAECLAVIISNGETISHNLERLSILESSKQKVLTSTLAKLLSNENKSKFLMDLAPFKTFATCSVLVFKSLLEERQEDQLSDEEFSCLIDLLGRPEPTHELIELAFKASKFCDVAQLDRLQTELSAVCTAGNYEFSELKLRTAELSIYDKKIEEAKAILTELKKDARLRRSILEFYDRVGLNSEKRKFLEESFTASLTALVAEGASPSLIESLDNLFELLKCYTPIADKKVVKKFRRRKAGQSWDEYPDKTYSYTGANSLLHITDLESKTTESKNVSGHSFRSYSAWTILPNGNLFFVGGIDDSQSRGSNFAVEIDTQEFTASSKPSMKTSRYYTSCAYLEGKIFVLAGYDSVILKTCESFDLSSEEWEAIPDMPSGGYQLSAVEVEATRSILAIGGYNEQSGWQTKVQEFSLDSMTWKTFGVQLGINSLAPCFKLDRNATDVYIVTSTQLLKLDVETQQQSTVKTQTFSLNQYTQQGPNYYVDGTLYTSNSMGPVSTVQVGAIEQK
mmetsp:Transcript_34262/g.59977  ORF Transcript_34262/g.59977 Transcript_34262/m.59977 type:complete len:661 (+) Transcript_34262:148-2130(+)|eukprot:CAMPEP_0204903558 /NCGR_PEP_ID=MMETSP1397-20131031/4341_1 /ASSEMBLY_ACC=CAM_ASM_000891 /TAXON_ID=49980 /ORGANISM="Climacostomum Climacostomum virens, Strain Stock W-24" /LENGTH=660 /DNA_ID=CAMNT_0052072223 /DNA_START=1 /DNA_END=1983 /DNA_ORIENTATION=+